MARARTKLNYKGGGVASLRVDHDFGETQFRSISAYRRFNSRNQRDNDGSPVDFGQLDYRDKQWQVSQEFSLFGDLFTERLRYTAGLYFFHEEADSNWFVGLAPGLSMKRSKPCPARSSRRCRQAPCPPVGPTDICAGGAGNPINFGFDIAGTLTPRVNATSYAAFTELEFDLTDQLTLIAGGRITYDKKHYSYEQSARLRLPDGAAHDDRQEWTDFSPRISLTYTPADDLLFYATVSSGYKAERLQRAAR
ncbi:MAG: TonB-dependent receptor [Parvularculaceae bacterium]